MKTIILFLAFILTVVFNIQCQVPPDAFNYSSVIRDSLGQPIANDTIGVQILILKTSPTGTVQYDEIHSVITDNNGLFNLIIGNGTVQNGAISTINWSNDNYFLKVGIDITGVNNFIDMGSAQLLSVPYALHAKFAGSVDSGGIVENIFTHFIGEEYGGGVVFHLWKDTLGIEHGLILDLTELSTSYIWSNVVDTLIGPTAQSYWDGLSNSNAIVAQAGHTTSAAALCLNSTSGGYSDWYLPSLNELIILYQNKLEVNKKLSSINGATVLKRYDVVVGVNSYLSSTEYVVNPYGNEYSFSGGWIGGLLKSDSGYVRAIRAF